MIFVFHQFSKQRFPWDSNLTGISFQPAVQEHTKKNLQNISRYLIVTLTKVLAPCYTEKGYNRTGPKYHSSAPGILGFIHFCWNTVLPTSFIPLAYDITSTIKFYSQPDSDIRKQLQAWTYELRWAQVIAISSIYEALGDMQQLVKSALFPW